MPISAGTRLGRYEVSSLLGAGGMGEVYLAQDTQLRRPVALKLLPADFTENSDRLLRFEQEAYAASALNHPNILTIYEIGKADDVPFIAAEFVDGETLRHRMSDRQTELSEVLDIAIQVASALTAAHEAGIVHRDIKPENIMVRGDGYIKVLDFGLAKLIQTRSLASDPEAETIRMLQTGPGMVVGTVNYMSPEQVRGLPVDARTDIWSLGVVIYEMVSGTMPFKGLTQSDIIASILREDPPPLAGVASDALSEIQRIVNKAVRKDQDDRCQRARDMALDLKSLKRDLELDQKSERYSQHEVSSVAILPFKNLAKDASVSFYEFSLADAVITELVRLRSLVVRPSSAISRYLDNPGDPLEAGRELKVNAVLAATFLHAPGRVRVTAQLLNVRNGEVLWGDRIDSQADDIIAIQDIIAQRIVDGLNLQLGSDEQVDLAGHTTANVLAYEEYLRGRDRVGRYVYHTVANDDIESAIKHFQRAIEIDSRFALAHCALGSCYMQRILKGAGKSDDLSRAKQALDKGLALDPRIIEARVFMVFVYLSRGDKQKGRIQIAELRDESPNNPTVHFVSAVLHRLDGEYEKALRSLDRLLQLNPAERLIVGYNRARISMYQGQYDDALIELDRVEAIGPQHPLLRCIRAQVLFYRADTASALEILEDVLIRHPEIDGIRPLLAQVLSALGKHQAAQAQLTDRVKEVARADHDIPYWLASAYVMEDKLDEAFEWFEKAINAGNENLPWFKANPVWAPLHTDPRFKELMRRVEFGLRKVV